MVVCRLRILLFLVVVLFSDALKSSAYKFNTLRELQNTKFAYLTALLNSSERRDLNDTRLTGRRLGGTEIINLSERFRDAFLTRTMVEPRFIQRFVGELFLALILQGIAEYQRRGTQFLQEIDYVIAGMLTALIGKGIAAFRSAPSVGAGTLTNAFQLGDYTFLQRFLSFMITPAPKLFISGAIAGGLGYLLSRALTFLRLNIFKTGMVAVAPVVPILPAAIYTGLFLVFVSGPSYQVTSGLFEQRIIDRIVQKGKFSVLLISTLRIFRSLLASALAIRGMQLFGLQKTV